MNRSRCTVLVADDEEYVREELLDLLKSENLYLLQAATAAETWKKIKEDKPDLVLLDIKFPDCRDLSLLKKIKSSNLNMEIIIISGQTENIPQVVEAIKLGAFDYVPKPFVHEELLNRVNRALELLQARKNQAFLLKDIRERHGLDRLVGDSEAMEQAREMIRKFAPAQGCVLINGESGTGKELAARALHALSNRCMKPFVVVNCAAIPESLVESTLFGHRKGSFTGAITNAPGKFEAAGEGTVFLDEIGEMPLSQQAALLRVLEYRKFTAVGDVREKECRARFLLATNRDLRERIREGAFREDLFHRINVAKIVMPPLRARPDDIAKTAAYFCEQLTTEMGRPPLRLAPEVLALFQRYDWPGNVRELKNLLEGTVMLSDAKQTEIRDHDLPSEIVVLRAETDSVGRSLSVEERREKRDLIDALRQCRGNQSQAARLLGWHRNTVRVRIRFFGLSQIDKTDEANAK